MDQDDPEKRIAELEHQLAERRRGADLPPALPRTLVSVDGGGFQQVGTPGDEARFGGQRPRRTVGWTGRVDVETIVVIGIVVPVLVTMLIPSSALWTSGIVCNAPSHLAYSQSLSLGHGTSRTFQCVSGDSSYAASKLAIYALQTLVSALVLCGTVAAGHPYRHIADAGHRKRSGVYAGAWSLIKSSAMSASMSSCPPTIPRRPASTRSVRASTPNRSAAASAWRRKLE